MRSLHKCCPIKPLIPVINTLFIYRIIFVCIFYLLPIIFVGYNSYQTWSSHYNFRDKPFAESRLASAQKALEDRKNNIEITAEECDKINRRYDDEDKPNPEYLSYYCGYCWNSENDYYDLKKVIDGKKYYAPSEMELNKVIEESNVEVQAFYENKENDAGLLLVTTILTYVFSGLFLLVILLEGFIFVRRKKQLENLNA